MRDHLFFKLFKDQFLLNLCFFTTFCWQSFSSDSLILKQPTEYYEFMCLKMVISGFAVLPQCYVLNVSLIFHWCLLFLTSFVMVLHEKHWTHETKVFGRIIFVHPLFVMQYITWAMHYMRDIGHTKQRCSGALFLSIHFILFCHRKMTKHFLGGWNFDNTANHLVFVSTMSGILSRSLKGVHMNIPS